MAAEQPGVGDVHVNRLLTNISIGYKNPMYISEEIFPVVLVNKQGGIVPKYDKSHWFRDEAQLLSPTQPAPTGGYTVDVSDTYYCHTYGYGHIVSDERLRNEDEPFDALTDGMRFVVDKVDMRKERAFVGDFWKTSVWGTDWTGSDSPSGSTEFVKFSDYGASTPIQTIRSARRTIRRAIGGRNPNRLVLGDLTWDVLEDHPDFLARIQYGSGNANPAIVTPNLVAQALELDRVIVGYSVYTADEEGTAEASVTYSANWDDDALLYYAPATPSLMEPAAGYTFAWQTTFGGQRYVRQRRDPVSERGELIEAFESFDQKSVATDAGLFMSDAAD